MNIRLAVVVLVAMLFASGIDAVAREVLSEPEQPFPDAKIGRTYEDSKPGTIALTKAPLDDRFAERGDPSLRPSLSAGRADSTYYPGTTRIPEPSAVNIRSATQNVELRWLLNDRLK